MLGFCEHGSGPSGFIKCGVILAGHGTRRTVLCSLFVGWLANADLIYSSFICGLGKIVTGCCDLF
jgi:hypothetical protein